MPRRSPWCMIGLLGLLGLQLGCQPPPPAALPAPPAVAPAPPPSVQEAPGLTAQERQEAQRQMDCAALGAVARKVAYDRAVLQVTEEEALAHVARRVMEHLQTTATPDSVRLTGARISSVVRLVYTFPTWSPEEAAFSIRNLCLGNPSTSTHTKPSESAAVLVPCVTYTALSEVEEPQ
jgi:hypothetical protein